MTDHDWHRRTVMRDSAIRRMRRSRDRLIRKYAMALVNVEASFDHYRWLATARMSEIRGWAADIADGVEYLREHDLAAFREAMEADA